MDKFLNVFKSLSKINFKKTVLSPFLYRIFIVLLPLALLGGTLILLFEPLIKNSKDLGKTTTSGILNEFPVAPTPEVVYWGSSDFSYISPELFLLTMTLLLFTYSFTTTSSRSLYNYKTVDQFIFLSLLILFFTFLLSYKVLSFENRILFKGLVVIETSVMMMKLLCLGASAVCLLISKDYLDKSRLGCFEFFILYLLAVFGIIFFISSCDFFHMFLSLEIQGICFFALVAMNRGTAYGAESSIKYFILGSFSSAILLYGISLIYSSLGSTHFMSICFALKSMSFTACFSSANTLGNVLLVPQVKLIMGFVFVLVALLFKITAAPFHQWAPDIYEGAPFATVVFISIVPKIAVFFILSKFTAVYFTELRFLWEYIFLSSGALSIILGTLLSTRTYKTKRFIAYSSITHMGYILIGLSVGTIDSLKFSILYVVVYAFSLVNFWSVLSIMENNYMQKMDSLSDFRGIFKANKLLGCNLVCVLFSLAGLPPFSGFYAKFFLLTSMAGSSLYIITLLVVVSSLFSIYYYVKVIKAVIFDEGHKHPSLKTPISLPLGLITSCSFFALLFFYYIPVVHTTAEYFILCYFIS